MTFDPDNPSGHKAKPKQPVKQARNEFWKITGPVYTGPVRKCTIVKQSKTTTWIFNEDKP